MNVEVNNNNSWQHRGRDGYELMRKKDQPQGFWWDQGMGNQDQ